MNGNAELATTYGRLSTQTKIERYGWTVKDAPGKYIQIDKGDLHIDKSYQRNVRPRKVAQMVGEWSWLACGALSVVLRDSKYFVLDGGHRLAAAEKRADIRKLPCLVFEIDDIRKEADSFLVSNTMRASMYGYEKINARALRGDKEILAIIELLESTGHFIGSKSKGKEVACIELLLNSYSADAETTQSLWPICVEIHNNHPIHGDIWRGLFYLQTVKGIKIERYLAKLKLVGRDELLQSIQKAKAFLGAGGVKPCAVGIANIINYRLMEANRIEI